MKKIRLASILYGLFFLTTYPVAAQFSQPGELDTTFNFGGASHSSFSDQVNNPYPGGGADGMVQSKVIQPDGKVLIVGMFIGFNGILRSGIVRLNQDGSMDSTFNPGTGTNGGVYSVVLQPDGKVLIAGDFTNYNDSTTNRIARLNTDGSLDTSFNVGSGTNNSVRSMVLQPDGKVLIGGQFLVFNGISRNRIARLNVDGSLDTTFNPGIGANNVIRSIALQPDGKVVIGGSFTSFRGSSRNRIARVNSDGTGDLTFNIGSGANDVVVSIALQSDGKVIIGGSFTSFNGVSKSRIARLNSNGSLETGFVSGLGANNSVFSLNIQQDGKVLLGGNFTSINNITRNRLARLNVDGSLDSTFNQLGPNNDVLSIAIQSDGKIIIGGEFTFVNGTTRIRLARLNANGTLDAVFNPFTGANFRVYSIALQPDGRILVGGQFTTFNGVSLNRIARLNSDGSLDTSFNPGTGGDNIAFSLGLQPDGKIVITGFFTFFNGSVRRGIARLNADGSLDTTFNPVNPGFGASFAIFISCIQPDGKLIIGGAFTNYVSMLQNNIARLNIDGKLDTTFNSSGSISGTVLSLSLQPDGKVLMGGLISDNSINTNQYVTRLNTNGNPDTSFNTGTGPDQKVNAIALQPDGKVLIGGDFFTVNSISSNGIARLNTDGSLDGTFNVGLGANGAVQSLTIQPDGKVLIAGSFTSYNGTSRNGIARINSNGSLDTSFDPGIGANNEIRALAIQQNGSLLIGGEFLNYNGAFRNRIARVLGGNGVQGISNPKLNDAEKIKIYPNPTKDYLTVESKEPFHYEWYSLAGKRLKASNLTSAQAELATDFLAPGTYILKIITSKGFETRKVVKE